MVRSTLGRAGSEGLLERGVVMIDVDKSFEKATVGVRAPDWRRNPMPART